MCSRRYRCQDGVNLPFKVLSAINDMGRTRLECNITVSCARVCVCARARAHTSVHVAYLWPSSRKACVHVVGVQHHGEILHHQQPRHT